MLKLELFCLLIIFKSASSFEKNFCASKLCPPPQFTQHLACKSDGKFSSKCEPDIRVVRLDQSQKDFIVDFHNYQRLQVASGNVFTYLTGNVSYFPTAARMMKLIWDEELAVLASLQLKTCVSHDGCHNTYYNETSQKLVMSGQNIAFMFTTGEPDPVIQNLKDGITNWMEEAKLTPLGEVDLLQFATTYTIGHFTQMVHDKNTRVGCAMVRWTQEFGDMKCTRFTCNYYKSNYLNQPLYMQGPLCSNCSFCDENDMIGLCLQ